MTNFCGRNSCNRSACAAVWSYVIASYLGSKRIFKIFNSKWSYDKILIDWVRSGRTGKYLALGKEVRTSLRSVSTPWPRGKYFPVRPPHSVNKYIIIKRTLHVSSKIWTFVEITTFVARTISHSFAALTREILFLPLEHKVHIFSPPCNILYLLNPCNLQHFIFCWVYPLRKNISFQNVKKSPKNSPNTGKHWFILI